MNEFDGITINGDKSVEEFVATKEQKELYEALKKDNKVCLYGKGRSRYKDHKEKHGKVIIMEQSRINKMNLGNNLKNANTNLKKVVLYLLAGKVLTKDSVAKLCRTDVGNMTLSGANALIERLRKTPLGMNYLIINRSEEKKRNNKYSFTKSGRELKPDDAFLMLSKPKSDKEEKKNFSPEVKKESKLANDEKEISNRAQEILEEVLSKIININVSGRIEIVFKIE